MRIDDPPAWAKWGVAFLTLTFGPAFIAGQLLAFWHQYHKRDAE